MKRGFFVLLFLITVHRFAFPEIMSIYGFVKYIDKYYKTIKGISGNFYIYKGDMKIEGSFLVKYARNNFFRLDFDKIYKKNRTIYTNVVIIYNGNKDRIFFDIKGDKKAFKPMFDIHGYLSKRLSRKFFKFLRSAYYFNFYSPSNKEKGKYYIVLDPKIMLVPFKKIFITFSSNFTIEDAKLKLLDDTYMDIKFDNVNINPSISDSAFSFDYKKWNIQIKNDGWKLFKKVENYYKDVDTIRSGFSLLKEYTYKKRRIKSFSYGVYLFKRSTNERESDKFAFKFHSKDTDKYDTEYNKRIICNGHEILVYEPSLGLVAKESIKTFHGLVNRDLFARLKRDYFCDIGDSDPKSGTTILVFHPKNYVFRGFDKIELGIKDNGLIAFYKAYTVNDKTIKFSFYNVRKNVYVSDGSFKLKDLKQGTIMIENSLLR